MHIVNRLKPLLPYCLLLLGIVLTMTVMILHGRSYIDSDTASEMILADLLNQEGSIVSTNWWYSTEIRVFGAQ